MLAKNAAPFPGSSQMRSPALGYDNEAGIALRPIVALFLIVFVVVAGFAIVMAGDKYHWGWTEISVHYASRSASRSERSRYSGASVPFSRSTSIGAAPPRRPRQ